MEKLELKHIAPYLPYKLKCEIITTTNNVLIERMTGFDCRFFEYVIFGDVEIGTNGVGLFGNCKILLTSVKPILRPLSDLTKLGTPIIQPYTDCITIINQLHILNNDVSILPYQLFEILIKHHFDVFGLIDKGLAIDINKAKEGLSNE